MMYVFFFNDTATTEIYTLSLHDALPIYPEGRGVHQRRLPLRDPLGQHPAHGRRRLERAAVVAAEHEQPLDLGVDRKSTRLNSSHANISYAVFCLKKKTKTNSSTAFIFIS